MSHFSPGHWFTPGHWPASTALQERGRSRPYVKAARCLCHQAHSVNGLIWAVLRALGRAWPDLAASRRLRSSSARFAIPPAISSVALRGPSGRSQAHRRLSRNPPPGSRSYLIVRLILDRDIHNRPFLELIDRRTLDLASAKHPFGKQISKLPSSIAPSSMENRKPGRNMRPTGTASG